MSSLNLKGEAVLGGVAPRGGWWLINLERRRVYGRVIRASRDGSVVMSSAFGSSMRMQPGRYYGRGYTYTENLPTGRGWRYQVDLRWSASPPAEWLAPLPTPAELRAEVQ